MTSRIEHGGHVFEMIGGDPIEVSSLHRPDTGWALTDSYGHLHQWYANGQPARGYNPTSRHTTPTLRWVVDGTGYYPDGEPYDIGHHECAECGQHIEPAYTADTSPQYIPGLRQFIVDGKAVSEEEARRIAAEVGLL